MRVSPAHPKGNSEFQPPTRAGRIDVAAKLWLSVALGERGSRGRDTRTTITVTYPRSVRATPAITKIEPTTRFVVMTSPR